MPIAPGASCSTRDRSGSVSDGNPCGINPTVETPRGLRPKYHDAAMLPPTATSGAGECGQRRSMPISTAKVATATARVSSDVAGMCWTRLNTSAKEALLGEVDAQQFGHLVEHDHEPDSGLEASEHGSGDEVGHKPQSQQPGRQQNCANQRGQCGCCRGQLAQVAVRHRQPELRAGQDGQCRGRTDAEHARGAEQRIDQHRNERGIQAHGHRQAGHGGVGHGLGQHDRCRDKAGDHIQAQRCCRGPTTALPPSSSWRESWGPVLLRRDVRLRPRSAMLDFRSVQARSGSDARMP